MELEELLQAEGIAAEELQDTLTWARGRAEELAAGLSADAELGPLLSGEGVSQPVPLPDTGVGEPEAGAAQPVARGGTEPSMAPPADSAAALADALAAELAAETAVDDGFSTSEPDAALTNLPPPPERPDLPEVGPGVEAGPMADAAYDQGSVASTLPEPPEDEPLPGVPDPPASELEQAAVGAAAVEGSDDTTQPRALMSEGHEETPGVTHSGSIEIDEDEIELLDDDDLELVEDDEDEQDEQEDEGEPNEADEPAPPLGGNGQSDEVPEWQAALTSAQLGGGAKADQESGLYRLQGTSVQRVGPQPDAAGEPPPTPNPAAVDKAVEGDESMDVDLGDL